MDYDELNVLGDLSRSDDRWTMVPIHRSGGGQGAREARQRLKRKGYVESHPDLRRVWRLTSKGRDELHRHRAAKAEIA